MRLNKTGLSPSERDVAGTSFKIDLKWILATRVFVLAMALLSTSVATFLGNSDSIHDLTFLYKAVSLLFALCMFSGMWLRFGSPGPLFVGSHLVLDVFIVTGIIYATGGSISPFLFLYLPIVMVAAILLSRTIALLIGLLSGMAYSLMMISLQVGLILPADGSPIVQTVSSGLLLQIIGLCSGMVLIAIATTFLTKQLQSSYELVAQSNRSLTELNTRQKNLFDGFPEGIITTRIDGTISSINHSALKLLEVAESDAVGELLINVLKKRDRSLELNQDMSSHIVEQQEFEFKLGPAEESIKVICHGRVTFDNNGQKAGMMFILQDVTKLRSIEEQLQIQERMARLLAAKELPSECSETPFSDFIGDTSVMQKVFTIINKVAGSDATVLISGESGTGKELVAKAIHGKSPRRNKPFIAVNCGAIPENLIESELFGHKRGAYTGAETDSIGLFRQAQGGTLFLDEIGELPLHMQTKLLRALQEKMVRPVGGTIDIPIDVRIVAATNKNLRKEVEAGNFREDLYYRLNVINIQLPALRERKDDIPLLVNSVLKRLVGQDKTPMVPPATMKLLLNYNYPGNVRELENILERAHVLGGEIILPEHLPESIRSINEPIKSSGRPETKIIINESLELPIKLDDVLAALERNYLELALSHSHGAKKKAAELLGINFRSFRYRLQKFGLGDDPY